MVVIYLNISVEKVIQQIEVELLKAKASTHKNGQFRERIASIRSLCELVLEEEGEIEIPKSITNVNIGSTILPSQPLMAQPSVIQKLDDEQSGSLLDF